MPVIAAHEINLRDGNMAIYNGLDCALTYEVDEARRTWEETTPSFTTSSARCRDPASK